MSDALRPAQDSAYARAGVDIAAGNQAVRRYRDVTSGWTHPDQLGALGGFSGLFRLPGDGKRALVGSTDGVGTKILIAAALRRYDTVGADLVNHCVNDILVTGADPLFFLDYLAVGKLDPEVAALVVSGVHRACRENGCALLGGETAEMPGVYRPEHFDLAGTIVGIVDLDAIPDPNRVQPGDAIVGLPAVGLHTNGYTLARALIAGDEYGAPFGETTFADALLAPHPSYLEPVRAIRAVADVKSMAHITGGGLLENVPRTLPEHVTANFEQTRWDVPAIMRELVARGDLSHEERYRTLNMGVGYTLIVPITDVAKALEAAPGARVVGFVQPRREGDPQVIVRPARTA
ncbi:MAG TPA: phosphoribosylformylglycinamidine cyclo-ligase [Candidatus Limnocylindrales bacterium]|nr:phosphoribosylformylglycinamidine cyclo-ligase [Candidatus Limnocylindrales bacterium]